MDNHHFRNKKSVYRTSLSVSFQDDQIFRGLADNEAGRHLKIIFLYIFFKNRNIICLNSNNININKNLKVSTATLN